MHINKIEIKNFRNIEKMQLVADEGINIIYGENAQGKTNIIEAIWLFTGAKSFRGVKDSQLIKIGKEKAELNLSFFCENREQTAVIEIEKKRRILLNEIELKTSSELAGNMRAIVFSPQDLSLINDGPSARRKMLDLGIGLMYPTYIDKIKRYNHTLQQRNALLKEIKYNNSLYSCLEDYNAALANQGAEIIKIRKNYIEKLKLEIPTIYIGLADKKEMMDVVYKTTADINPELYKQKLKTSEKEDLRNFSTSVGPHRDDLVIFIENKNARIYASQGQRRSAALTLKLSQAAFIKKETKEQPIALLDDVLSELDEKRQNYILNHIKNWQVFITCCDPFNIERLIKGKVFKIEKGKFTEA